jgi:hypothetical protein
MEVMLVQELYQDLLPRQHQGLLVAAMGVMVA